ncbi:MAG: DUF4167 domain-containing protein [Pseudomonadota bacterium]
MAQNSKRGRNNNNRRRPNGNNPNRSMDSTGPEVKIRGTAAQIYEKYQGLARDANSSGDRVRAESLLQHAEHYYRMMKSMQLATERQQEERQAARAAEKSDADKPQADKIEAETDANPSTEQSDVAAEAAAETPKEEATSSEEASSESETPRPRRTRRRRQPRKTSDSAETATADSEAAVPEEQPAA